MRIRHLLSAALAASAAVALAAAPGAGAAVPRIPRLPPNLPRVPRVTTYRAQIDVGGYIDVKAERDTTADCAPGQDVTIEFETAFELGSPRASRITIVNGGLMATPVANPGGVSHKAALSGYRETNHCPPNRKVTLRKPACTSGKGKLRAVLGSDVSRVRTGTGLDDLEALSFPVLLALTRMGGAAQDRSCTDLLSSLRPARNRDSTTLSAFEYSAAGMSIPIGVSEWAFVRLARGGWLRRWIRLDGACDHVLVGTEATASRDRSRCTVTGRIYVGVKRLD